MMGGASRCLAARLGGHHIRMTIASWQAGHEFPMSPIMWEAAVAARDFHVQ